MSIKNNKKVIFGALSAVVASVAAGVLVKNNIDKKIIQKKPYFITLVSFSFVNFVLKK